MGSATQSLQPLFERLRHGWRTSSWPALLAWWGGELRALLPTRWRAALDRGEAWHLLQREGGDWVVRRAGRAEPLARWHDSDDARTQQAQLNAALQSVDGEDRRVALLLPARDALRRTLLLPLAARSNLLQVMAFEMDRQTPFNVGQVHYAARELPLPVAAGRFSAELVAVPRDTLDPQLAHLSGVGIAVDAVDLAAGDDRLGINLLPPQRLPRRVHPRRRLNFALTAGCVLLLLLVLGQWLHNRRAALVQMQAQVAAMHDDAQQVIALRQQLQDNAGAAGFLVQRKQHGVSMLSLLEDVTRRLPGSAWLERFSVDASGQVSLQGQGVQAARLLDALKGSPLITDAAFQGSIQPDPTSGKERFYLVARLRTAASAPATSGSVP